MRLKKLLLFYITFTLFFSFLYAQNFNILKNNTKKNIDTLAYQLNFLTPNYQKNENKIRDLLKLYYENYSNIVAFEIKQDRRYLYSSYKKDEQMYL